MVATNVVMANQALTMLGEASITTFSDGTFVSDAVNLLYEDTVLDLLTKHQWRFANVRATLAQDGAAATPRNWTYGYTLPDLNTDRVGYPIAFYVSSGPNAPKLFEYELGETWAFTNAPTLICEYTKRIAEAAWPAYFVKLARSAIAEALCLVLTENQTRKDQLKMEAYGMPSERGRGGLLLEAITADNAGRAPRGLVDDDDIMRMARFGG